LKPSSDAVSRLPVHYGWLIVLLGGLTIFSCIGLARFGYGMLLPSMRSSLGLAYDQMGFISTGNFIGYLCAVALAPFTLRRFRPRGTVACGLLLVAVCLFGISRSTSFFALFSFYTLIGVGGGFANIPLMVLISHWFRRRYRGRANGLMIVGNGCAIMLAGSLVPVLNRVFGVDGWRMGWLMIAGVALVVGLLVALLVRNDPADVGLSPLGEIDPLPVAADGAAERPGGGRLLIRLGLIYSIFGMTYMVYGTFIVSTMVGEYGFAEAQAGNFWFWVGFFSLFSSVGFGLLSDRIGRRHALMLIFSLQALAYLLAGSGLGSVALLLSVLFYGLSNFAVPTVMAAVVADCFGLKHAAAAFSAVTLFFAVGQSIGPGAAGMVGEAFATFRYAYLAAALFAACAVPLAAGLPRLEAPTAAD